MAQNNIVPMRDIISVVPMFNGHNITLAEFLEGCDLAATMTDLAMEQTLVCLLRGKLEGEVRKLMMGNVFATLDELKNFLRDYYFSGKTIHQLLGNLGNIYQKEGERVVSYANKV